MVKELDFRNRKKPQNRLITNDGVFFNGKKVAKRYYTINSTRFGALSTEDTKRDAQKLIKKRRSIFGNQYKHLTKKAGGRYIVYVGSNKK
jgi:hypothetical protein